MELEEGEIVEETPVPAVLQDFCALSLKTSHLLQVKQELQFGVPPPRLDPRGTRFLHKALWNINCLLSIKEPRSALLHHQVLQVCVCFRIHPRIVVCLLQAS